MLFRILLLLGFIASYGLLPVHAQTHRHLEQTHLLEAYPSLEAWLGRATWLRDHIRVSTGLWPMPEYTPQAAQLSAFFEEDGYRVRTVTLETQPGFYLTGTLFYPPGNGPFPAILSPHGHWSEGRFEDIERASIPGRALSLARQGYVVFSYSMLGYNETRDLFPHRFDEPHYRLWGFSVMGLQLWNSIQALDLVSALPEVDPTRIGMTGASGGGTQTFLLTAIDDRIRVSAPVNMISAHFQGGCICENAPLLRHNLNNVEIGALAAPRPLLLVSTSGDWTANTPDTEFPAIQQVYGLFDARDRVHNAHFNYPHNYNKDSREAMYAWFATWLLQQDIPATEAPFSLPESALLNAPLPSPPASPDAVFASFRAQAERQLTVDPSQGWRDVQAYRDTFGTALSHILSPSQQGTPELTIHTPDTRNQATDGTLIVHHDTEAGLEAASEATQRYLDAGEVVALLSIPSAPMPQPDSIAYWTTYNPTAAQHAVHTIMDAATLLNDQPDLNHIDLVGLGSSGALTLLARSQLPFIRDTRVDFNGVAYESDADFLAHANIPLLRRAGDFKTATAMIVPAHLEIDNLPDGTLARWIRSLYKELGASTMLTTN